jgi:hypothetical protein
MWSVGCILGELLGRQPMFQGSSTVHQLDLIVKTLGRPSQHDLFDINSQYASAMCPKLSRLETPLAARYPKVG